MNLPAESHRTATYFEGTVKQRINACDFKTKRFEAWIVGVLANMSIFPIDIDVILRNF